MSDEKTIANNDQPAGTAGQFEPETRVISQAMYVLAEEIQSGDGVANAACRQAAERLDAQMVEIARLRAALRTTQEPVVWIRGSGMEMLKLENGGVATVYASPGMSNHSTPLYTAPPEAAPRQPLTRERVKEMLREYDYEGAPAQSRADFINGVRCAEAAHGIGVPTRLPADDTEGGEV